MASASNFLTDTEKDAVVAAIRAIELHTSGEIRVHIDERCDQEAYDRAVKVFYHLKMDKTPFRNGVLIYIAVKDRKFSVIGDEAIHEKVGKDFWTSTGNQLGQDLKNEHYSEGIIKCIDAVGKVLTRYFPDVDELNNNHLPDDISYE